MTKNDLMKMTKKNIINLGIAKGYWAESSRAHLTKSWDKETLASVLSGRMKMRAERGY